MTSARTLEHPFSRTGLGVAILTSLMAVVSLAMAITTFIALENVGYVLLNLAFLFIGVAMLSMPIRLWRAAGWVFAGVVCRRSPCWCSTPSFIGFVWTTDSK
jgi:hypothetical protein